MAESESYQSQMFFFSLGFFHFCEGLLHPGTSFQRDSKKKIQDVGPPVISGGTAAFSIASYCTARAENAGRIIFTD